MKKHLLCLLMALAFGKAASAFTDDLFSYYVISDTEVGVGGLNEESSDLEYFYDHCNRYGAVAPIPKEVSYYGQTYQVVEIGRQHGIPHSFAQNGNLRYFGVPSHIKRIGDEAFANCYSLLAVSLPEGLLSIGKSAFGGCENLLTINLPEGLTDIGESAFSNCKLRHVDIPQSVTSIGRSAFGSSWIRTVVSRIMTPFPCDENTFYVGGRRDELYESNSFYTQLYIPSGTTEVYQSTVGWNKLGMTEIGADDQEFPKWLYLQGLWLGLRKNMTSDDVVTVSNFLYEEIESSPWPESEKQPLREMVKELEAKINTVSDDLDLASEQLQEMTEEIYALMRFRDDYKERLSEKEQIEQDFAANPPANDEEAEYRTQKLADFSAVLSEQLQLLEEEASRVQGKLANVEWRLESIIAWLINHDNEIMAISDAIDQAWRNYEAAIISIESTTKSGGLQSFDLNGRVRSNQSLRPGIYVRNNRKVVVR